MVNFMSLKKVLHWGFPQSYSLFNSVDSSPKEKWTSGKSTSFVTTVSKGRRQNRALPHYAGGSRFGALDEWRQIFDNCRAVLTGGAVIHAKVE